MIKKDNRKEKAQEAWENFTQAMTYTTLGTILILALLAVVLL